MLGPGERFARRYTIEAHLGAGGMGDVYRARDDVLGEDVALKVLAPSRASESPSWLARFREEVRLARRVAHKNVARVYDLGCVAEGSEAEMHYLTMELVVGESLRRRMRRPLSLGDALSLGHALAAGIAAAHEAGVVHGDLKPGNAMVDDNGRLVLIDFGLARSVDEGRALTNVVVGTPVYMAPEQLEGERAGAGADVYALGLVLFELVARERPFGDARGVNGAMTRLTEAAPALSSFRAVPSALDHIVGRCLARDPAARPKAIDVERALATLASDMDASTVIDAGPLVDEPTALVAAPKARAHSIAVLPFRTAPSSDAGTAPVADGLTEALRELLGLTDGLRVLSTDAARGVGVGSAALELRAAGIALGVDAVVDGEVTLTGGDARIAVQVVDAESGTLLLRDELVGRVSDLLRLQDHAARRIAEELRVTLVADAYRAIVPDDAVEGYLRARVLARNGSGGKPLVAFEEMERCLVIAPDFLLAHATRAIAAARLAIVPTALDRDWAAIATTAVSDALARAPGVPDTHLADALLAQLDGRFRDAVKALERALALAPAYAEAHEQLGRLEMESGNVAEGCRRLFLAAELDGRCSASLAMVVRAALFRGRADVAARAARRVEDRARSVELIMTQVRAALWRPAVAADRRDLERLSEPLQALPVFAFLHAVLAATDGDMAPLQAVAGRITHVAPRSRYLVLVHQVCTEGLAMHGHVADALLHLEVAADRGLFDLDWLEQCPALATLRDQPRFAAVRSRVVERISR